MKTRKEMPVSPSNNDDDDNDNDNGEENAGTDPQLTSKKGKKKKKTAKGKDDSSGSSGKSKKSGGKECSQEQVSSTPIEILGPLEQEVPSSNGPATPVSTTASVVVAASSTTSTTAQSRRTRSLGRDERHQSKSHDEDRQIQEVEVVVKSRNDRWGSKKCGSGGQITKILLCGSSSGSGGEQESERESKRKEVDENNPTSLNPDASVLTHRGRKTSRKGSKKKSKEAIPLNTLEDTGGDKDKTTDSLDADAKDGKTSQNSNKTCCFCWCCCCSCSCLSGLFVNGKGSKEANKNEVSSLEHFFSGSDDQLPSQEEIKSWGESFDKLMKCPWGRKVFRDFLKCEYSEENILFWLACEDLKNETDPAVVEEKCRVIYEDYISILSPKEVSLDSRVREIINKNMMNPSKETFAEAQLQIYTLMHRDSYPRFVNSPNFKELLEQQSPGQESS